MSSCADWHRKGIRLPVTFCWKRIWDSSEKIALEQYRNMGLDENDIGIDLDDLMQEGSIGLLNAIPLFDAGRGMKVS